MRRARLLLGVVLYLGLIAYEYAPFAYQSQGNSFPSRHLLLVAAITAAIGFIAAHYAILALPAVQIFVWAVANDDGRWGSSFALLIVILAQPVITAVLGLGVFLGQLPWTPYARAARRERIAGHRRGRSRTQRAPAGRRRELKR